MDRFHLINVFVAVVDTNGFAGAARKLRISPPAVTRAINELESHLGVSLLVRTTRVVRVTESGARFVEDCRHILTQLAEADASASGFHQAPRGRLIVTAPVPFGAMLVTPIVTEYLQRYADVSVSCWFLDRVVNLLEEGADVGVRIGDLPDSSMQAIRVGRVRRVVCAAPSYLKQHGVPENLSDLQTHIVVSTGAATLKSEWRFLENGKLRIIKVPPRLVVTSAETAVSAALSGFGIANVLSYQVEAYLREGRLRAVLNEYAPAMLPVHVVHREVPHASKAARAFVDLAVDRLRASPTLK